MRRLLPFLAIVGCGRVGFSTTADDSQLDPDAPSGATVVRFGERPTSDVRGVTADTYLSDEAQGSNFGASPSLTIELTEKRALLQFDITAIPPGATVVTGRLHLVTTTSATRTVIVAPVLEAWTAGTRSGTAGVANWTERTATQTWKTAGAGRPNSAGAAVASFVAPGSVGVDLPVTLVQGWVDAAETNFGIVMTTEVDADVHVSSAEATASTDRPELVVTYVP